MRHLITHFNALLLGMTLGMIFVAIVHTPQSHLEESASGHGITIGYEIVGAEDQTTVVLIAGTTMHEIRLPAKFCAYLANQGCRALSFVITRSASFVRPAGYQQPYALRK